MSTLNAKVILNVKTAAEWANSMEVLLEGELGIESDTRLIKIGNGVDTFSNLPYTAASDINDIEGVTVTSPTDGNVLTYSNGEWVNITPSSLPADTDLSHYDNTTSGFITASDIPALPADTDLSHYDNTISDFATVSQIPTDVSQLNNDAGYITSSALPSVGDGTITIQKNSVNVDSFTTNQNTNKTINITVPTNVSELNNDVGYLTTAVIPTVNNGTLTIKQDNVIIATFTANSATNVVANLTSGGGGGGGASYTSQLTVDSSLIPDTDSVYNLGDSTHRWTYLYSQYLSTGDGSNTTVEQSIVPSVDTSFNLGSSSNQWDTIYTNTLSNNYGDDSGYITVDADLNPISNNKYFLGDASSRWAEVCGTVVRTTSIQYFGNGTLQLGDRSSHGMFELDYGQVGSSASDSGVYFAPNSYWTGNTSSIGTKNNYFGYGYFNNMYVSNLKPRNNVGTADIGTSTYPFDDIYGKKLHASTSLELNGSTYTSIPTDTNDLTNGAGYITNDLAADLLPATHATYNLGSSSKAWLTLYASQINGAGSTIETTGTICPSVDEADSLGGNVNKWNEIHTKDLLVYGDTYTDTLKAKTTNGNITVHTNLRPSSTYNLGASGARWSTGYFDTLNVDEITSSNTTITFSKNPVPSANGGSLGNATYRWTAGWFQSCTIGASAITPTSGAINLGDNSNKWAHLYISGSVQTGGVNLYNSSTTAHTAFYGVTDNWVFFTGSGGSTPGGGIAPLGDGNLSFGQSTHRWALVYSSGGVSTSDRNKKDNIQLLEDGLSLITRLPVYSFTWKDRPNLNFIGYGMIAQEVREIAPELVEVPEDYTDGDGTLGMYTNNVLFLAVKAIQELSSKVDELNAKIKVLEGRV